ncbi:MAG: hypothetical protein WC435_02880 [Candidatus Paceibacterota bacterium]
MIKVFAIIEVKNGEFDGRTIEARFFLAEEARVNGDNRELAAVIETKSGEISFLSEKLKERKFFFFFPFEENYGSCLFFKPENWENAEGGFQRGCDNISSTNIVPQKTRLGILMEQGNLAEMVLIKGGERRSLLN